MKHPSDTDLPLNIVRHENLPGEQAPRRRLRFRKRYLLVLLIPVFMFTGAVIGLYFQPPALQKFYALTGLQPGGGSRTPDRAAARHRTATGHGRHHAPDRCRWPGRG